MTTENRSSVVPEGTARYALFMLTLAYVLNFIDRQILVIIQEPIKKELLLSDAQLGLLSGFSFALVYITAGIPIAYWADRGNRRNIIVLAITVWSGMTALSGLARSFSELLLARIGVGIGEAGGSPPAHSMISDYYPPKERATALGIYSSGVHIGVLIGFLAGGFIAQAMGWRVAFMAVGLPGILFAAVMYFTVREPERGRWETAEEAQYTPTLGETITLLMKFRSFWFLAMGCGLTAFAGYGNGNFTPPFLMRSHGLEVGEVGVLLAVFGGGGGIIGTLLGGKLADHLGTKDSRWYLWVPAIAGTLALPLTFPYLLLDNTTVVMGLLFVVTILINTYLGPCIAMAHALVPPAMRSLTSAILFFVLNLIGLGMGPLTAGILSDYFGQTYGDDGLRYAMLVVGMVASLGILMFFMAARTIRADLQSARALKHT
jgi:predicted MFS family arabinose efflux permease